MHSVLQERVDPDLGGVDLARGEQRGKLGRQPALLEHGVQPAQRLQRAPRQGLAPPLPQDGAQLVVLSEAHPVVAAIQVSVGHGQQVTDLPVSIVHHGVEHGHLAKAWVIGAARQGNQVRVGVVIDPQLAHAGPERPVAHDRGRDHIPAGRARYRVGRDLPARQRARGEIPERPLACDRLVHAGDSVIRGDDPPQTPPAYGGAIRPPVPPRPDRAVQRRIGRINQASLDLKLPADEQVERRLLAVLVAVLAVRSGPPRFKHGRRGDRSAVGRHARRYPAAGRTAGTAAGPPRRSWRHAGRRHARRPA